MSRQGIARTALWLPVPAKSDQCGMNKDSINLLVSLILGIGFFSVERTVLTRLPRNCSLDKHACLTHVMGRYAVCGPTA